MMAGGRAWTARRRVAGQSTLEYILVLTAILIAAGIAVGAGLTGDARTGAMVPRAVTKVMTESTSTIEASADKIKTGLGL